MGFVSRLLGLNKKAVNVIAPVDVNQGKYVLTESFRVKMRATQLLPPELKEELIEVCRSEACIRGAWFLDVLEPPTGDMKLFISMSIDAAEANMPRIANRMRDILRAYPPLAGKYFIGANIFAGLKPEQAVFIR